MASALGTEKLKLVADLALLRQAISADVRTFAAHGRGTIGLFGSLFSIRRLLLGTVGSWLGFKTARKLGLSATVSFLASVLLQPAVRTWVLEKLQARATEPTPRPASG